MKEKIKWYQEVLELEPNSKVFFPLAKLLIDSGDMHKAVQTLQNGLARHPEYIEARLYLIDVLFTGHNIEACQHELQYLEPIFTQYSGFWQAWGESFYKTGKYGDAGIALSLLAHAFHNGSLDIANLLANELFTQHTVEQKTYVPAASQIAEHAPEIVPEVMPEIIDVQQSCVDNTPFIHIAPPLPPTKQSSAEDEDTEEWFSLRTRSMAEVLAEQGDYAGALEIYQELANMAINPEEKADLHQRMTTLASHMHACATALSPAEHLVENNAGKVRVLSVLEALAHRLEARLHG